MNLLSRFGIVLLIFSPFIGIPIGFLLVYAHPYASYALAIVVGIFALLCLIYGIAKMIATNVGGSGSITFKTPQEADDFKKLMHEYRHRNAQDGKY